MKYAEMRFSGSGGQGLGLAGLIAAEAAIAEGYEVCQTQSYGPEARGGSSRTDVIVSRKPILFPNCRHLDFLLAMNQESCSRYAEKVKEDSIILVDSTFVDQIPEGRVYECPLTLKCVEEFGSRIVANVMALGVLAALSRYFKVASWRNAIIQRVPERFRDLNLKAFELGHKAGREILHIEEGRVPVAYDRKLPVPDELKRIRIVKRSRKKGT
ncbi:2-oxoacid:acceptor oxidoreductase family protein [Candidatus Fermentibacterales bacterium]|nr:2-oxoacid:acceptor oxidoreductase family protein [Candidatus Fermentibacterales bacterium]